MNTAVGIAIRAAPVLVVLVGTLVAFGAGVDVTERPGVPEGGLAIQAYYAIGLFFLGGMDLGVPTGGPEWARNLLWVLYFLGPAITTTAVAEGAIRVANPRWLRQLVDRHHVVIVGTGRIARLYADVVRGCDPGRTVDCIDAGAFVHARHDRGLQHASTVVLAGDDDLQNLGLAWEVRRAHPALRVVAHVGQLELRNGTAPLAEAAGIELFNAHEIAAAEVFDTTLGPHFRATERRDLVAILGFGRFGQTVLRHLQDAARGEVERVVVIDREATRSVRQYREQTELDPGAALLELDADVRDPRTWELLADALSTSEVVPVIVLATDDDSTNLQAAIGIRRRIPAARLFVRCYAPSAFLEEVEKKHGVEAIAVERILREALRVHYRRA
ncbi:MAG: NAD-binding protein [Alphaproteobacteria bacterium]|nr:NAD-binding protein [Alphaproteobacteria bacterium]